MLSCWIWLGGTQKRLKRQLDSLVEELQADHDESLEDFVWPDEPSALAAHNFADQIKRKIREDLEYKEETAL